MLEEPAGFHQIFNTRRKLQQGRLFHICERRDHERFTYSFVLSKSLYRQFSKLKLRNCSGSYGGHKCSMKKSVSWTQIIVEFENST